MIEILLARLSKSLYNQVWVLEKDFKSTDFIIVKFFEKGIVSLPHHPQALKKISEFVNTNILPGAVAEVGLLCCACVHSNPEEAVTHLIEPLLLSVISSLKGMPVTGFGGRGTSAASTPTKVFLL